MTGNQPDAVEQSQARPTPREVEIIRLVATGKANKEIGLRSVAELIHDAIRNKIVSEPNILE